jgi:hypothetical protein
MTDISEMAGQNWLITPAALAVNQAKPSINDQEWLLVLSGVALVGLKGTSPSAWLHDTLNVFPDWAPALNYAIVTYGIPTPPLDPNAPSYDFGFQVDQEVPFAAISSIYDKDQSNNAGFAVDVWRPSPWVPRTDFTTGQEYAHIFQSIAVDVAVRDSDAYLYRVSYHITLLGKIRFLAPTRF